MRSPLAIGLNNAPVVIPAALSHARKAATGQEIEPRTIATVAPLPSWSVLLRRMVTFSPASLSSISSQSRATNSERRNAPANPSSSKARSRKAVSSRGTSDMILRNTSTGGLEVYDINSNQITGAAFMGTVGLDWQLIASGNFSSIPGESDIIMRNVNTGGLEIYDVASNQITGAFFLGNVGLDWQFAGVAPVHAAGASDLVLRNVNTGAFEVYDIANNQLTGAASLGAVGTDWQLGGFAADPPTGSMGSSGSASQLVQAMAGFGGGSGAAESLHTAPLGAETSQQQLLTTPQHA
jgi:hypothetical protein